MDIMIYRFRQSFGGSISCHQKCYCNREDGFCDNFLHFSSYCQFIPYGEWIL